MRHGWRATGAATGHPAKNVDALSGGERQRLALIMGILLDRDIWILDEITTGLDLALKTKMVELVLSYNKTILVVKTVNF